MMTSMQEARDYAACNSRHPDPAKRVGVTLECRIGTVWGTNTIPRALFGLRFTAKDRDFYMEHAERDAIANAHRRGLVMQGATMYTTRFPCADCARAIVNSGIARVVYAGEIRLDDPKYGPSCSAALRIFRKALVKVEREC